MLCTSSQRHILHSGDLSSPHKRHLKWNHQWNNFHAKRCFKFPSPCSLGHCYLVPFPAMSRSFFLMPLPSPKKTACHGTSPTPCNKTWHTHTEIAHNCVWKRWIPHKFAQFFTAKNSTSERHLKSQSSDHGGFSVLSTFFSFHLTGAKTREWNGRMIHNYFHNHPIPNSLIPYV